MSKEGFTEAELNAAYEEAQRGGGEAPMGWFAGVEVWSAQRMFDMRTGNRLSDEQCAKFRECFEALTTGGGDAA